MEAVHPTFRIMEVTVGKSTVTVDFNEFEIKSKKNFKVCAIGIRREMINFSNIKAIKDEDRAYLDYIKKEYGLIAVKQITAKKNAEKDLSQRRA